jgi:hypothetical protein
VPIVLGVVGHCDIHPGDEKWLRPALERVFHKFKHAYPTTPLVVLSALAEGADLLAAEVALECGAVVRAPLPFAPEIYRQSTSFHFPEAQRRFDDLVFGQKVEWFVVPLPTVTPECGAFVGTPFPLAPGVDDRSTSFSSDEGRLRLTTLLTDPSVEWCLGSSPGDSLPCGVFVRAPSPRAAAADSPSSSSASDEGRKWLASALANPGVAWSVTPLSETKGGPGTDWLRVATDKDDPEFKTLRHTCYANVGGYIVRHCHALVALWDRDEDTTRHGPSGTAEFVAFKLHGRPGSLYPWTLPEPLGFRGERGLVFEIPTRREEDATTTTTEGKHDLVPQGAITILVPNDEDEPWSAPLRWLLVERGFWSWARGLVRRYLWHGLFLRGSREDLRRVQRIEKELSQFRKTCLTVDHFNRSLLERDIAAELRRRLEDEVHLTVADFDDKHNRWLRRLGRIREAAAAVSTCLQPKLDGARFRVFFLLGLSAIAFELYAHLEPPVAKDGHPEHYPLLLLLYLVFQAGALGAVIRGWWLRLDARRLDARALAEALRVRQAWAVAGVGQSVADSYLGQLRGEISWIRQALLHVCPPSRVWAEQFSRLAARQRPPLLKAVRERWVKKQITQFEDRHKEHHHDGWALRLEGRLLWGVSVALLVVLLVGFRHEANPDPPASNRGGPAPAVVAAGQPSRAASAVDPRHQAATQEALLSPKEPPPWLLILSPCLVIVGGLCIAYRERRAHEELSNQYERMRLVFVNGDHELALRLENQDIAGCQRVIEALGREAIMEHTQWLILRRSRPLEHHI